MPKKEHKKKYRPVDAPDSIWNRGENSVLAGDGKKSLGGKEIMQMLGIDHEEDSSMQDKAPLKMMDLVMQIWDGEEDPEGHEEEEVEDDEEEG